VRTVEDQPIPQLSPTTLLDRLLDGRDTVVLDVRDDSSWPIQAEAADVRHVPASQALAQAARLARELPDETVVVCNRGISALEVAQALSTAGRRAAVLEDGMRGWIGVLRSTTVELDIDGFELSQVQRPGRGCLSYVLAAAGEAVVVDPAPNAGYYLELAAALGARITHVIDTHLHADHLSGARELAGAAGATLRLPQGTLDRGVEYAAEVTPVHDGDLIPLGDVELRAIALSGHTTDMTGLLVAGRALISGDSLFADAVARPDLQTGDAGGAQAMARLLHTTLHERVLTLDGDVLLLPGHDHPVLRAGALAPSLTAVRAQVPELSIADAETFATRLLAGMPPRPANYEQVIAANSGRRPADPELETGGNSCAARAPG
jgi:glyoxylase-like metal-dependent hydrolase (beta-lactamase superfamily II)/rhodanese-related sulfurtransferase